MVVVVVLPVLWPALVQALGWILCLSAIQFGGTGVMASSGVAAAGKSNCEAINGDGTPCPSALGDFDAATSSDTFIDPLSIGEEKASCSDVGQNYFRLDHVYAYSYIYTASVPNRRGSKSENKTNGIRLECDVRVEGSNGCRHLLKVKNCTISEQWQRGNADVNSKSDSFSKEVAAFPLAFVLRNGTAKELWSNNRESTAILNFKRGILSTLIARKTSSTKDVQWEEREDVQGTCPTKYFIDEEGRVILTKDHSICQSPKSRESKKNFQFTSLWNKRFVDFFGVSTSSQCSFKFRRTGELSETICTETHSRAALSQQSQVSTRQVLTLSGVSPLKIPTGYDVREYRKVSAHYQHEPDAGNWGNPQIINEGFSTRLPDLLDTILSVGSQFLGEFQDGVNPTSSAQAAISSFLPLLAGVDGIDANILQMLALGLNEDTLQTLVAATSQLPMDAFGDLLSVASMLTQSMSEDGSVDRMHNWLPENQKKDDKRVLQLLDATQEVVTLAGIPLVWSAKAFVSYLARENFTDTEDSVGNRGFKKDVNISGELSFENRLELAIPNFASAGTETITSWSTSLGGLLESIGSGNSGNFNFRLQLPVRELQILSLREKEYFIHNFVTEQLAPHSGGLFSGAEGELWCSYAPMPFAGKRVCVSGSDPSATFTDFLPFIADSQTASWDLTLQHLLPDPVAFRMQLNKNDTDGIGKITSLFLHILGANTQDGVIHLANTNTLHSGKVDLTVDLPLIARFNASVSMSKGGDSLTPGFSVKFTNRHDQTYAAEYSTRSTLSAEGQSEEEEEGAMVHSITVASPLFSFGASAYRQNNKAVIHLHKYSSAAPGCDNLSSRTPEYSIALKVDRNSITDRIPLTSTETVADVSDYPVNVQVVVEYPGNVNGQRGTHNVTLTGSFDLNSEMSNSSLRSKFLAEGSDFKQRVASGSTYIRTQDRFRLKHNWKLSDRAQTDNDDALATYDLQVARESSSSLLRLEHSLTSGFFRFWSALITNTVAELLDLDMNVTTHSPFWDSLNLDIRQLASGEQETMNLKSSLVDIDVVADWSKGYDKTVTFKSKNVDIIPNMIWKLDFEGIHKGETVIRLLDSSVNFYIIHQVTNIDPFTFSVTVCVQERCSHPQIDLLSFLIRWTLTVGEPDCLALNTTINQKLANEARHIYATTIDKLHAMFNHMIDDLEHPLNKMADRFFGFTVREQLPALRSFLDYFVKNTASVISNSRQAFGLALKFLRSSPAGATCSDLGRWAKKAALFVS